MIYLLFPFLFSGPKYYQPPVYLPCKTCYQIERPKEVKERGRGK